MSSPRIATEDYVDVAAAAGVTYAEGTQLIAAFVWIMDHDLGYHPAGWRFMSDDGVTELEPESVTYVNLNRSLATWPSPVAGTWMAS